MINIFYLKCNLFFSFLPDGNALLETNEQKASALHKVKY